jgi:hypothetical protein
MSMQRKPNKCTSIEPASQHGFMNEMLVGDHED